MATLTTITSSPYTSHIAETTHGSPLSPTKAIQEVNNRTDQIATSTFLKATRLKSKKILEVGIVVVGAGLTLTGIIAGLPWVIIAGVICTVVGIILLLPKKKNLPNPPLLSRHESSRKSLPIQTQTTTSTSTTSTTSTSTSPAISPKTSPPLMPIELFPPVTTSTAPVTSNSGRISPPITLEQPLPSPLSMTHNPNTPEKKTKANTEVNPSPAASTSDKTPSEKKRAKPSGNQRRANTRTT